MEQLQIKNRKDVGGQEGQLTQGGGGEKRAYLATKPSAMGENARDTGTGEGTTGGSAVRRGGGSSL